MERLTILRHIRQFGLSSGRLARPGCAGALLRRAPRGSAAGAGGRWWCRPPPPAIVPTAAHRRRRTRCAGPAEYIPPGARSRCARLGEFHGQRRRAELVIARPVAVRVAVRHVAGGEMRVVAAHVAGGDGAVQSDILGEERIERLTELAQTRHILLRDEPAAVGGMLSSRSQP